MKITIEIDTTCDIGYKSVDFDANLDQGHIVVKGVEVWDDCIMAIDGTEFSLNQVDEANYHSAQYIYNNTKESDI